MRIHVALMTEVGLLWFSESPYRHNKFPLTPIWCYRRGRDGAPYGVIRRLKDIQVDVNKRASKALHILSTSKIIMDYDALPDDMTFEEFQDDRSLQAIWVRWVLTDLLDFGNECLLEGPQIPASQTTVVAEYALTLRPDR